MARAQSTDYLHSMRFHVTTSAPTGTPGDLNHPSVGSPEAGFSACTTPTATVEAVEYKEGQYLYTRKYPGHVTYDNVTLSRGVARVDTGFWRWIKNVIEGNSDYRVEVSILHYHRADVLPGPTNPPADLLLIPQNPPSRVYRLYEAFPAAHKFASDLDATESAISIMSIDIAFEHCSLLSASGDVQ